MRRLKTILFGNVCGTYLILKMLLISTLTAMVLFNTGCVHRTPDATDTVRQVSTLNALIKGTYESDVPVSRLTSRKAVGLGTPNHLNEEMIIFDGKAYRVDLSGSVHTVDPTTETPFAVSSPFEADTSVRLGDNQDYKATKQQANALLSTPNYIQTLKITGSFSTMKVRSVPRQSRPYKPLTEVVKNQEEFEYESVDGVLVGFRFPAYMKRLNASGYHLHFLSDDRTKGGHVLDFRVDEARLELDSENQFRMILPGNPLFSDADLSSHREEDVDAVEKQ